MPPTLEEVVYDLARDALEEQRDIVASLRSRAAPVLAGAGALAALLAGPAVGAGTSFYTSSLHAGLVCLGILGAATALVSAIVVLAIRDFGFSIDVDRLYRAAYDDREQPAVYLLRIAESHRMQRIDNRGAVLFLQRWLVAGLTGVIVEVLGFSVAIAVH
jgi:hypothetical protein